VSGNSGELAHKPLLKLAQQSNNRRQVAQGITNHNARRGALLKMDAEERALAGRDDDDDSQKSDSDLGPEDDAEKETYPCVVAVKYPLFESTFDLPALYMRIEATGKRGEGRQSINLNTCRFDQALTRDCLTKWLEFLPVQLAHYAFDNLWEQLGLQRTPEEARTAPQLDSIRQKYIDQGKNGGHAQTYGGIAIESDRMQGIVHIRARPFLSDQWYGKNPQDAVFMLPDDCPEEFDVRNPEHYDQISYGKVVLFFSVNFKSEQTRYSQVHNLCLVEELQDFTWHGAGVTIIIQYY
jgi:hypothetical protein